MKLAKYKIFSSGILILCWNAVFFFAVLCWRTLLRLLLSQRERFKHFICSFSEDSSMMFGAKKYLLHIVAHTTGRALKEQCSEDSSHILKRQVQRPFLFIYRKCYREEGAVVLEGKWGTYQIEWYLLPQGLMETKTNEKTFGKSWSFRDNEIKRKCCTQHLW